MEIINYGDDGQHYKVEIDWEEEGVKIIVSTTSKDDSEEGLQEAKRRAQLIVDHFKFLIGKTK